MNEHIATAKYLSQDVAQHMAQALRLAERGRLTTTPNPNVGCVIIKQGEVVGEGWHEKAGEPHAEVHALRQAGDQSNGATAYVTLEPCCHQGRTPACSQALIDAGIAEVVVAMLDPNPLVSGQGVQQLKDAGIKVTTGIGGGAAVKINRGFIKRMRDQLPFVTLKLACSLDGKTAMASGESQWITSAPARTEVHKMRAQASAILLASGTVIADNPRMTARLPNLTRQPIRVVLDRELKIPPESAVFDQVGSTWLVCNQTAENKLLSKRADKLIRVEEQNGQLNLTQVLKELAVLEINDLLVESGSRLAGEFVQQQLLDELVVFMSPDVLGSDAMSLLSTPGLEFLKDRAQFEFSDIRKFGRDIQLTLIPSSRTLDRP